MQFVDLQTAHIPEGSRVRFTLFWPDAARWEGNDFDVNIIRSVS